MADVYQALAVVLTAAVCTFITRAVPFVLFGGKRKMPEKVRQIAEKLPPAIIAVLVVYCVKDVSLHDMNKFAATAVSIAAVAALHWWRREILISIAGGTALYMILLRVM